MIWVSIAALLLVGVGAWWALTSESPAARRAVARSIRGVVGAPTARPRVSEPDVSHPQTADPDVGQPVAKPARPPALDDVSFVLFLGMDRRRPRTTGRTDSMIVAAFRHRDGKIGAFSIPRDLWIEIPELGPARISSVVRVGNYRLGAGKGLPLIKSVLLDHLGISIDHVVAVDFAGFVALVDHLGGIDVDVQCPIEDCFWAYRSKAACDPLSLEAGEQRLDGATALKFVRSRHGRGDRDRTRRQQSVLLALERRIRKKGVSALPELWEVAERHLITDLDWRAAAYYASFALSAEREDLHGFVMRKPVIRRHVTEDRKHVLLLDRERFDEALANLFVDPLPGLRKRKRCPSADAGLR